MLWAYVCEDSPESIQLPNMKNGGIFADSPHTHKDFVGTYTFFCVRVYMYVYLWVSFVITQNADIKNKSKLLTRCYPWGKVCQWVWIMETREKCQDYVTFNSKSLTRHFLFKYFQNKPHSGSHDHIRIRMWNLPSGFTKVGQTSSKME